MQITESIVAQISRKTFNQMFDPALRRSKVLMSGNGSSVNWAENAGHANSADSLTDLSQIENMLADYVTNTALETTLADYATKTYVDQNYLSLSFFNALFQARTSQGAVVAPNSGDTATIDNIKAMFGFWTDQYISALGQGADGGGPVTTLAQLNDVQLSLPLADGEVLTYSSTLGKWTNGAGVSTAWANITGKPTTIAGYGITDAHITNGVITLGSNSITPITSLTGYATETWVSTNYVSGTDLATTLADYVTTTALGTTLADYVTATSLSTTLADYATKTYVDQNYLSLSFFNALFQARTSQGATVAPNSGDTTTIDNIKAMFGFWTDQYLSALGQGADGGTVTSLAQLTDVELSTPVNDGEVLTYSTTLGKWTNGAGVSTSWANITGKPTTIAGYGITDAHIANGVITLGSNSITPVTSLSGYATQTWVGQQGYISGITSSMVTTALGYTPANSTALSNYLPLSGGTLTTTTLPSSSGVLNISTTNSGTTFGYSLMALSSSLQTNSRNAIAIGRSFDYYNSAILSYTNIGNASTSNYFSIGLWSVDDILCIVANGKVGIGKSAPTEKLDVDGSVLASSFKKSGGTSSQFLKADGSVDSNSYVTSSGVTSVATGTGLTGGTITSTGTISIDSTYQTYISHGESAYNSLSNYLPLSGGTMTGIINMQKGNSQLRFLDSSSTILGYVNWSDNSFGKYIELWNYQQNRGIWIGDMDTTAPIYYDGNAGTQNKIWHSGMTSATMNAGSYPTGTGALNVNATYASSWSYPIMCLASEQSSGQRVCFCLGRNFSQYNVAILNFYYSSLSSSSNYFSIGLHSQNDIITGNGAGNVGIGTGSPAYKLHVAGDIYATGGVTALSDIRHKTIVENTRLQVSDIASMRAIRYIWDDGREDNGMHVGSIAQDWQQILPEVVLKANDTEGTLSLQYGVAALISSITIARKVVDHEKRITELERECADWREAYNALRMDYEQLILKIA